MQTRFRRGTVLLGVLLALAGCAVLLLPQPSPAEDKLWVGDTGWWNEPSNWAPPGQPIWVDDVTLKTIDRDCTVYYYNTDPASSYIDRLSIYSEGSGTMTLNQEGYGGYAHTLRPQSENVGYYSSGTGRHIQSAGATEISEALYVGLNGRGIYELSGSGSLSATNQYIGYLYGTGTFIQTGGSNTINSDLYVGYDRGCGTYELSGSGSLSAEKVYVGKSYFYGRGTGTFTQTGGANTVKHLSVGEENGPSSGTYNLEGGTLSAGTIELNPGGIFKQTGGRLAVTTTFNQAGGAVLGSLENRGTFNYFSGFFAGRLVNYGTANLFFGGNTTFSASDGLANYSALTIPAGNTVALYGQGLNNAGSILLAGGTLSGDGPLMNLGQLTGFGAIGGTGGFSNYGSFTPTSQLSLSNTGSNLNYGRLDLAHGQHFVLDSSSVGLQNLGDLNLNRGILSGAGYLINKAGGVISGQGSIETWFSNSGLLALNYGTTTVSQDFTNFGIIQLTGSQAILAGGTITNVATSSDPGTLEGYGQVLNNLNNYGRVEALYSTLNLKGSVANYPGGVMTAMSGKLFIEPGLADNAGAITLSGGAFDNNNKPLTNTGQISGYGSFSTGGLSNQSTVTLTGGPATVNGPVTNEADGGQVNITANTTFFTGPVTNKGTVKITSATVTWAGGFTNDGAYISDPATNSFTDLIVGPRGYLVGGTGDTFIISDDFINQSLQNTQWQTDLALLRFVTGTDTVHDIALTGADQGPGGYGRNFAWGSLDLTGQILNLLDGDLGTPGAALYVGEILGLTFGSELITNIYGNGLKIFYDPDLPGNDYLHGLAFDLMGGGHLMAGAPAPLPASAFLFGGGLLGLAGWRRYRKI